MLHADRLCLGFALERCLEIHVQLAIEHLFCLAECEGRTTSESLCEVVSRRYELCCGNNAIVESHSFGFGCADEISGKKHFGCFSESHDARQEIRSSHVSAGQSDLHKQESDFGFFACDANVGSKSDAGA